MCIIPVRHKVKELIELVQDDDRLKQERKRAKKKIGRASCRERV